MKDYAYTFTVKDLFKVFYRNISKIIIAGVLGVLLAMYFSQFIQLEYEAKSDILIDSTKEETVNSTLELMPTFKDIVISTRIIENVNEQLETPIDSNKLLKMVRIEIGNTSQVMTVYVKAENKEDAKNISNLFVQEFKSEVQQHFKSSNVIILNEASINSKTDEKLMTILFYIIGFLLLSVAVYLICLANEVYRPKLDSEVKVEALGQNLLAISPRIKWFNRAKKMKLGNKSFQFLASELQNENNKYPISILLMQRNLKQENTVMDIAKSYVTLNKNVLIIKLKANQNEKQANWANYINNEIDLEQLIENQQTNIDCLEVDYSEKMDTMPINEILFNRLLTELQEKYDVLLFTTDIKDKAYTFVLSQLVKKSIYIVDSKNTTMEQAETDLSKMKKMKQAILGTVLIK